MTFTNFKLLLFLFLRNEVNDFGTNMFTIRYFHLTGMRTLLALNDSDAFVGRQDLSHKLKTISFDSWRVEQRFIAKHFLEFLL